MDRRITLTDETFIRRCHEAGDTVEQIAAWTGFTEHQVNSVILPNRWIERGPLVIRRQLAPRFA